MPIVINNGDSGLQVRTKINQLAVDVENLQQNIESSLSNFEKEFDVYSGEVLSPGDIGVFYENYFTQVGGMPIPAGQKAFLSKNRIATVNNNILNISDYNPDTKEMTVNPPITLPISPTLIRAINDTSLLICVSTSAMVVSYDPTTNTIQSGASATLPINVTSSALYVIDQFSFGMVWVQNVTSPSRIMYIYAQSWGISGTTITPKIARTQVVSVNETSGSTETHVKLTNYSIYFSARTTNSTRYAYHVMFSASSINSIKHDTVPPNNGDSSLMPVLNSTGYFVETQWTNGNNTNAFLRILENGVVRSLSSVTLTSTYTTAKLYPANDNTVFVLLDDSQMWIPLNVTTNSITSVAPTPRTPNTYLSLESYSLGGTSTAFYTGNSVFFTENIQTYPTYAFGGVATNNSTNKVKVIGNGFMDGYNNLLNGRKYYYWGNGAFELTKNNYYIGVATSSSTFKLSMEDIS